MIYARNYPIKVDVRREENRSVCELYQVIERFPERWTTFKTTQSGERVTLKQLDLPPHCGGKSKTAKKINQMLAAEDLDARVKSCDVNFVQE